MDRRSFLVKAAGSASCLAWGLRPRSSVSGAPPFDAPFSDTPLEAGPRWVELAQPLMGSVLAIAIFHPSPSEAKEIISGCFSAVRKHIAEISPWEEESAASRLNRERSLDAAACPASLLSLLASSASLKRTTKGAFTPYCWGLSSLWREAKEAASVPAPFEIRRELRKTTGTAIVREGSKVALTGEGSLDFGAIGKGFITDLAHQYLASYGVRYARISASGDLRFLGDGRWIVDIEHPRKDGMLGTIVCTEDCAVSTSGDYRECWEVHGERYHHLISPENGMPGRHCQSVTVICKGSCKGGTHADALASGICLMPPSHGMSLIERLPGVEGVIVASDGSIASSRGFRFAAA